MVCHIVLGNKMIPDVSLKERSTHMKIEKMKSVNVLVTDLMLSKLDARCGTSRSHKARRILAAIIAAFDDGLDGPFLETLSLAHGSTAKSRRRAGIDESAWRKAIIWVPESMHLRMEAICSGEGLRVADFIRGAVIMATDEAHVLETAADRT